MAYLLLVLPGLASVLLAAHFYRAGQLALAIIALALVVLLAVPRAWAARTLQVALVLGAVEWLRTLASFAAVRVSFGQPYLRIHAAGGLGVPSSSATRAVPPDINRASSAVSGPAVETVPGPAWGHLG
jgi:hypothetical protein